MKRGRYYSVLYGLIAAEIFCCGLFFYRGPQGLTARWQLQQANATIEQQLATMRRDTERLKYELAQWESNYFYKEKIAREHLQMARVGDIIYYLT